MAALSSLRSTGSTADERRRQLQAAVFAIVATDGLEGVSVRQVAARAGVSIGTVQHYYPTKDDMLLAAFGAIVERVRERIGTIAPGLAPRATIERVLRELLPLDRDRHEEAVVQAAFSARAATAPHLRELQRQTLEELQGGLTQAFRRAGLPPARARTAAHVALATVDGLALHAVSAEDWLSPRVMTASLRVLLDALLVA